MLIFLLAFLILPEYRRLVFPIHAGGFSNAWEPEQPGRVASTASLAILRPAQFVSHVFEIRISELSDVAGTRRQEVICLEVSRLQPAG